MMVVCENGGSIAVKPFFGSECQGGLDSMMDTEDVLESGCQDDGTVLHVQCGVADPDLMDGPLLEIHYASNGMVRTGWTGLVIVYCVLAAIVSA